MANATINILVYFDGFFHLDVFDDEFLMFEKGGSSPYGLIPVATTVSIDKKRLDVFHPVSLNFYSTANKYAYTGCKPSCNSTSISGKCSST